MVEPSFGFMLLTSTVEIGPLGRVEQAEPSALAGGYLRALTFRRGPFALTLLEIGLLGTTVASGAVAHVAVRPAVRLGGEAGKGLEVEGGIGLGADFVWGERLGADYAAGGFALTPNVLVRYRFEHVSVGLDLRMGTTFGATTFDIEPRRDVTLVTGTASLPVALTF